MNNEDFSKLSLANLGKKILVSKDWPLNIKGSLSKYYNYKAGETCLIKGFCVSEDSKSMLLEDSNGDQDFISIEDIQMYFSIPKTQTLPG